MRCSPTAVAVGHILSALTGLKIVGHNLPVLKGLSKVLEKLNELRTAVDTRARVWCRPPDRLRQDVGPPESHPSVDSPRRAQYAHGKAGPQKG